MRCSCIRTSSIPCDCRHSRAELGKARLPALLTHVRARAEVECDNCEVNDGHELDNGSKSVQRPAAAASQILGICRKSMQPSRRTSQSEAVVRRSQRFKCCDRGF
jgi:hypothetical protein